VSAAIWISLVLFDLPTDLTEEEDMYHNNYCFSEKNKTVLFLKRLHH
jgi:hypothetical protein